MFKFINELKAKKETRKNVANGWSDYCYLNSEAFDKLYEDTKSDDGKVKHICSEIKKTLTETYANAPDVLAEAVPEDEVKLSSFQKIGNIARKDLFNSRRAALKQAELDETAKCNKAKQIDDLELVIQDSVALIAKGKYATKSEIQVMLARITAAEAGIDYESHDEAVDMDKQKTVDNILDGDQTKKAFSFEEALNEAKTTNFNI